MMGWSRECWAFACVWLLNSRLCILVSFSTGKEFRKILALLMVEKENILAMSDSGSSFCTNQVTSASFAIFL